MEGVDGAWRAFCPESAGSGGRFGWCGVGGVVELHGLGQRVDGGAGGGGSAEELSSGDADGGRPGGADVRAAAGGGGGGGDSGGPFLYGRVDGCGAGSGRSVAGFVCGDWWNDQWFWDV